MEILSIWRSPLDKVALTEAEALLGRQPSCTTQIPYNEDFSQMTIYNLGHYVAVGGNATTALTQMFSDMNPNLYSNYGGLAFIPQASYPVTAPTAGFTVPDQCNIVGSGGGGPYGGASGTNFFHFVISPSPGGASIFFSCTGLHTAGGKYFRSLAFQWINSSHAGDTCIVAHDTWNCRAINCTFTDCPTVLDSSISTGGTIPGEGCTLEQCTIEYTQGPTSTTAVILAGPQCGVIGPCEFSQTSRASGGPSGCTCIAVVGPAEHAVIADARIYEWTVGIDFSQKSNSEYTSITNCEIECWQTALNIKLPSNTTGTTAGVKVTSCTLAKVSDSTDLSPIVVIDANGNGNSQLNDITLLDCTVLNMALLAPVSTQHGLAIGGGSNIKIIGGTYSNNGPSGGAGIAITGPCSDVQIIGANLRPNYPAAPHLNNQQYALLVSGSPTGPVLVSGCDMTGYSASPVHVTGAPNELVITDCPGYNDKNTLLNNSQAPTGTPVSASSCSTPYFGPSLFTWSNTSGPVTVIVFGLSYSASSGVIFLPSPYDGFYFNNVPSSFSWVGK